MTIDTTDNGLRFWMVVQICWGSIIWAISVKSKCDGHALPSVTGTVSWREIKLYTGQRSRPTVNPSPAVSGQFLAHQVAQNAAGSFLTFGSVRISKGEGQTATNDLMLLGTPFSPWRFHGGDTGATIPSSLWQLTNRRQGIGMIRP
jgi:hypothetical protein